ncbi:MAG: hypothetical protein HFG69_01550 [Hungatella sp.]|jgi:hypothetical protein|nr:hypothetical protein [Hungatella sp.]
MSSKINKKKKSREEKEAAKAELRERNRQMSDQLAAMPRTGSMLERFTKWRMISYVSLILLPPYGLYRMWSKESTFVLPEKVVWTFIVIVYVLQLLKLILFS